MISFEKNQSKPSWLPGILLMAGWLGSAVVIGVTGYNLGVTGKAKPAIELAELRSDVLATMIGMPLPGSCDENGTANVEGDTHSATVGQYRVWSAGRYVRLGIVAEDDSVTELAKVKPDYLYSKACGSYQFTGKMDWRHAYKALSGDAGDTGVKVDVPRLWMPEEIE